MRSIVQCNTDLFENVLELKDLIGGHYRVIKHIEDEIFCQMRNKEGCINTLCSFFEFVPTNLLHGEDRCKLPNHRGCDDEYLLLATYRIDGHKRIEELISIISKDIPTYVNRWYYRDSCVFRRLNIDIINKEIYVIWKRNNVFLKDIEYSEDVLTASKILTDKRMPFFTALRKGKI